MDSQITPDRFAGHPITSFRVQERRSLTVHLEDAGKFDVMSDESANDEPGAGPVHAGRFDKFAQAADVAHGAAIDRGGSAGIRRTQAGAGRCA
jgi:hypothetical protein